MAVAQPTPATPVPANTTLPGLPQTQQPIAITVQLPPLADPHWTAYVTAVGTPIVAILAAGIAAYIAYRNWRTAQYKLKFELFERRYKIYDELRNLMINWMAAEEISMDVFIQYSNIQAKAEFLYDRKILLYLEEKVSPILWHQVELHVKLSTVLDPATRVELYAEHTHFKAWALDASNSLKDIFRDPLQLGH